MRRGGPGARLLRAIAREQSPDVRSIPLPQLERLVQAGLGPLLHAIAGPQTTAQQELLQAADFTARIVIGQLVTATADILRQAPSVAGDTVLLKGIAACQRHYPAPHQRLMGDIDMLVPRQGQSALEHALLALGYDQRSELPPEFYETHHHSMPFVNDNTGVWVEVHTQLFPLTSPFARADCFTTDSIQRGTAPLSLEGVATLALRDELHLLYTCSHWAVSLNVERALVPLLDVVLLLRKNKNLAWDRIGEWTATGHIGVHLSLVLGYLCHRHMVELESPATAVLKRGLRKLGWLNTRLLYAIIDAFIVERKSFGRLLTHYNVLIIWDTLLRPYHRWRNLATLPVSLMFPPNRADRFSLALVRRRLRAVFNR